MISRAMERFSCLGAACPDTCCSGWKVPIERSAHRRLLVLASDHPELHRRIEGAGEFHGDAERGFLRFAEDGRCGLLTEDGLCAVHGALGEEALHGVCKIYPRLVTSYGTLEEHLGALSCPEVLRLVLDTDDSLDFVETTRPTPSLHRHRLDPDDAYSRPLLSVRAAFLDLLEDDSEALGARFFTMLYVAERLSEFLRPRAPALPNEAYDELLAALSAAPQRRHLAATWVELPTDEITALNLATQILLTDRTGNERFRVLAVAARRALGLASASLPLDDAELESLRVRVHERRASLSPLVRGELRRALALYAKNHLLTHPYVEEPSPFRSIFALGLRLCALAVFLEGSLDGSTMSSEAETRAFLVETISAFARHLEHSEVFDGLLEELDRRGLVSLAVGTSLSRLF